MNYTKLSEHINSNLFAKREQIALRETSHLKLENELLERLNYLLTEAHEHELRAKDKYKMVIEAIMQFNPN